MTAGLLICMVTVCLALENVLKKVYDCNTNSKKISAFAFNLITVVSALAVFLFMPKSENKLTGELFLYSAFFAAAYFCSVCALLKAICEGSLSLTSLILSYSLILPTFYGVFFLKESLSVIKVVGIILLFISLYFVGDAKKNGVITKKWIIYIVLAFVGNGMCSTIQKMYQLKSNGDFKAEFMIIALVIASVALTVIVLFKEKSIPIPKLKNCGAVAIGGGIANAVVNMLVMVLAKYPSSIVFPTIQGGNIIITYIVSRYVYREVLNRNQNIGFCIGVLSVILINI